MFEISLFGSTYNSYSIFGQLLVGLINGSFYAMLSLGVAIIFGMLRIANFVHGAQYMVGAFVAWALLNLPELFPDLGLPAIGYWWALLLVPLVLCLFGMVTEKLFIKPVYKMDHAYSFLLTIGLAMVIEGLTQVQFGTAGLPYSIPEQLQGVQNLGFMILPNYRGWVVLAAILICFCTWFVIERTKLGVYLRAATENPVLVQALGINVPRMLMLTYGGGVALAGLAGVMAAPIYQVSPLMGQNMIIIIFAVVVIGGMGSIFGAIVSGFGLGVIEGMTKIFYPAGSTTVIFVVMAIVLLVRQQGLFGKEMGTAAQATESTDVRVTQWAASEMHYLIGLLAVGLVAPLFLYPMFVMKILCFALFAVAYNLIFGYGGLLAFGHAAFFGASAYVSAHLATELGWNPEFAILAGTAAATLLGALIGWLAIRRQGLYFAMITLAMAQIVYFYAIQAGWTKGEDGIQTGPRGQLFGLIDLNQPMAMYYVTLAIFLFGFAVALRTIRSPFGQTLKAIRENEPRAISLGYNAKRFKLLAFTISAALAGLAGSTKAIVFQLASLADIHFMTSGEVLLMALIGGIGTVMGPIVGAIVMVSMLNYLAGFGAWVQVIQGCMFVACVLFLRKGVVGTLWPYVYRLKLPFVRGDGAIPLNPSLANNSKEK
ncbi:ABC transporter permease [Noviherbaspirillum sp.]|uniref:ABC transporter permease n=1 Tax=Noviherbaspirillum sp. TaxID=1926288 RepID=UPI002B498E88|nr:branched-chain amino acid ABC transporter permease [Noviherbaspirillum sp.]HJV80000.1 branched-chain amino acid ABC transporter permease [Noviherbaspirillum sp.]